MVRDAWNVKPGSGSTVRDAWFATLDSRSRIPEINVAYPRTRYPPVRPCKIFHRDMISQKQPRTLNNSPTPLFKMVVSKIKKSHTQWMWDAKREHHESKWPRRETAVGSRDHTLRMWHGEAVATVYESPAPRRSPGLATTRIPSLFGGKTEMTIFKGVSCEGRT